MATFSRDWQEALPDNNTWADEIDDMIKNLRVDMSDRLKDMIYGFTAGENDGVQGFKQLEFKQQSSAAAQPNANEIVLYALDDGSNCGLYAKEENNNAAQILKYDGTNWGLNGDVLLPDTVDEDAIRLDNNSYLTARNAANDGDINLAKINASDVPEILVGAVLSASTAPGSDPAIACKKYVDDQDTTITDPTYSGGESHSFIGGLIIKMGNIAYANPATVTFGTAFPNDIITAVACGVKDGTACGPASTGDWAVGSVKIYLASTGGTPTAPTSFGWIAIGR